MSVFEVSVSSFLFFSPCFYIRADVTVEAKLKNDKFLGLRYLTIFPFSDPLNIISYCVLNMIR